MKKRIILLIGIALAAVGVGFAIFSLKPEGSRKLTFEECEKAGGEAWLVDIYDPAICSSCAEYQACAEANPGSSDIREVCPQVMACTECMDANFPYSDTCPDGRAKIGEISDAATWFQCCK